MEQNYRYILCRLALGTMNEDISLFLLVMCCSNKVMRPERCMPGLAKKSIYLNKLEPSLWQTSLHRAVCDAIDSEFYPIHLSNKGFP